ncbi:MAG: glycoside hydrolase family 28 protein [Candidatus Kapaibacteriota bacterium]
MMSNSVFVQTIPAFMLLVALQTLPTHAFQQPKTNNQKLKTTNQQPKTNNQKLTTILSRIKAPTFPKRDFVVTNYGVKAASVLDSTADAKPALQAAIEDCAKKGGGRVVVPAGEYFVKGALHLRSGVNLHLERGAALRFSVNPKDYLPLVLVRWEGTRCMNFSPLVYALNASNIAITGEGTLDGQTEKFWHTWKKLQEPDKNTLRRLGNSPDSVPPAQRIFGEGHFLRPDLVQFHGCRNILVEGVTLKGSPFWTVHPVFCTNATFRNLTIEHGTTNDDGIDPESCKDVLIERCTISTDDDCIAIKAGRDQDAWKSPGTENVIVRNCTFRSGVGSGFCIGSEMSGGVRNVFVENCTISRAAHGIQFKCNRDRGGFIEQIFLRNITMDTCKKGVFVFTTDYHSWRGNLFTTRMSDVYASKILCGFVEQTGIKITGVEGEAIRRIFMEDIDIKQAGKPHDITFAEDVFAKNIMLNDVKSDTEVFRPKPKNQQLKTKN